MQALARMGRPRYDAFGCDPQPDIDRKSFKPRMRTPFDGIDRSVAPTSLSGLSEQQPFNAALFAKAAKEIADSRVANKDAVHPTIQLFTDARKYHDAQQAYAVAPVPPACAPAGNPKPTGVSHFTQMVEFLQSNPGVRRDIEIEGELPVDPLDVEYDGVKLRELVEMDQDSQRHDVKPMLDPFDYDRVITPIQRAAISAHWSAQLRAKIAVSAERARSQVVVDLQDEP